MTEFWNDDKRNIPNINNECILRLYETNLSNKALDLERLLYATDHDGIEKRPNLKKHSFGRKNKTGFDS